MPSSPEHAAAGAPSAQGEVGPVREAIGEGWARVATHWRAVASAYLLSVLLALPLAAALQLGLRDSLAHREAAEIMLEGWDGRWHKSFAAKAEGLEATFDAGIVGIGAVLRSLDTLLRGALLDVPAPLWIAGLAYLLGWVLLSGGLLARFAGDDRGVVRLGALHFRRMLALAAVGWVGAAIVLGTVLPWLSSWIAAREIDLIDERVHAAWLIGKYAVVWALMIAIKLVVDYAKVAAIDEPTRSLGAALRLGAQRCWRSPGAVLGVAAILGAISVACMFAYSVVAPGVAQPNPFMILVAFAISQTSVIARVTLRAWGLASAQVLTRRLG